MKRTPSTLLSVRFVLLYVAAIGAFALYFERERWGSAAWFPLACTLVVATALMPLGIMFRRFLLNRSTSDWIRIIFFLLFGIATAAAAVLFIGEETFLAVGMFIMSGLFTWAALGTVFKWPGFRPPLLPHQCRKCRYDLTNNVSGICPECGTAIEKLKSVSV